MMKDSNQKLCVIGSLNTDLVAQLEDFPKPGQTIIGNTFHTTFGGKGGNQAVALGKLGADVIMAGKVGRDTYGDNYLAHLKACGVQSAVAREEGISSGVAVIEVDKTAQNHIVVIPGANGLVDRAYIDEILPEVSGCSVFLLQLEIPLETVEYAAKRLYDMGKTVILDPAPAVVLPDELLENVDYITPNETETEIVSGMSIKNEGDLKRAAAHLLEKGVKNVIAKAGGNGAYIINKKEFTHVPPYKVNPVDTTAAGDSFNAGLAFGLSRGLSLKDSVKIGNAVGGLATEAMGAQAAMPNADAVRACMNENLF